MKKLFILSLLCSILSPLMAQRDTDVLFTVGDQDVSVSEFKYIYEKNNGDNADYTEKSLDEYINLYKNFKLKVAEGKAMGLDTIQELEDELKGYRMQLAKNYLVDNEVIDQLSREIYERMKIDYRISHILFKEERGTSAMSKAKDHIDEIKDNSFEKMVTKYSEDKKTAEKGGDIGYVTSMFPRGFYEMENVVYSMNVGEVSDPIKSSAGVHIVKVTDKRPAKGRVDISHILIRNDKNGSQQAKEAAKNKINEVYDKLKAGGDFEQLARAYSQDQSTNNKGGYLGEFGVGVFTSDFEEKMFSISQVGDYTLPFETDLGWHIVKLNDRKSATSQSYEALSRYIKNQLIESARLEIAKNSLVENIKKSSGFELNDNSFIKLIGEVDSTFYEFNWKPNTNLASLPLLTFNNGETVKTVGDFQDWLKKNARERMKMKFKGKPQQALKQLLDNYTREAVFEFEESRLEEKYPEFKNLMREYSEGILLFEVTKRNVWDKASSDTTGLKEYFADHRSDYVWGKRSVVHEYIISSIDKDFVNKMISDIHNDMTTDELVKKYNSGSEHYIAYKTSIRDYMPEDDSKKVTDVSYDVTNKKTTLKRVVSIESPRPKTLKEAKGYVISDYQDHLEKEWISSLDKKYETKLNSKVLKKLKKD